MCIEKSDASYNADWRIDLDQNKEVMHYYGQVDRFGFTCGYGVIAYMKEWRNELAKKIPKGDLVASFKEVTGRGDNN